MTYGTFREKYENSSINCGQRNCLVGKWCVVYDGGRPCLSQTIMKVFGIISSHVLRPFNSIVTDGTCLGHDF